MEQIITDILNRVDKKTVQRAGARDWKMIKLEHAIGYLEAGGYPLEDSILEQDIKDLVEELKKESIRKNGKAYASVPLSFPAKGSKVLYNRIIESGYCTGMDGRIVDGKRIINVLLWIDTDTCNYHKVSGVFYNADIEV